MNKNGLSKTTDEFIEEQKAWEMLANLSNSEQHVWTNRHLDRITSIHALHYQNFYSKFESHNSQLVNLGQQITGLQTVYSRLLVTLAAMFFACVALLVFVSLLLIQSNYQHRKYEVLLSTAPFRYQHSDT